MKMNKTQKKLLIGLIVLALLTPIGLLATGTAFGEWGPEDLRSEVGYAPSGVEEGAELWHAPLPDYSLPGVGGTFFKDSIGYIFSAIAGLVLTGISVFFMGKALSEEDGSHD